MYESLPAWLAQTAISECQWLGVAVVTTSYSLLSISLPNVNVTFDLVSGLLGLAGNAGIENGGIDIADAGDAHSLDAAEAADVSFAAAVDTDNGAANIVIGTNDLGARPCEGRHQIRRSF